MKYNISKMKKCKRNTKYMNYCLYVCFIKPNLTKN